MRVANGIVHNVFKAFGSFRISSSIFRNCLVAFFIFLSVLSLIWSTSAFIVSSAKSRGRFVTTTAASGPEAGCTSVVFFLGVPVVFLLLFFIVLSINVFKFSIYRPVMQQVASCGSPISSAINPKTCLYLDSRRGYSVNFFCAGSSNCFLRSLFSLIRSLSVLIWALTSSGTLNWLKKVPILSLA